MLCREGDGRDAVEYGLHCGGDGAGIGNVKARVVADVDAGEHNVRPYRQQCLQRGFHAVRRSAADAVSPGDGQWKIIFLNIKRLEYRQLLGHGAALRRGGGHPYLAELHRHLCEMYDTGGAYSIVVYKQNLELFIHWSVFLLLLLIEARRARCLRGTVSRRR